MPSTDFRLAPGLRDPILYLGDIHAEDAAKGDGAMTAMEQNDGGVCGFCAYKGAISTAWYATAEEAWTEYCGLRKLEIGGDIEMTLPWSWAICGCCDGHGTDRGASVECDGGGFTASEWADEDDDFKADYLAGRYDRPCEQCGGGGKVKVPDETKMTPEHIAAWHKQQADDAEIDAIHAAERRMGS